MSSSYQIQAVRRREQKYPTDLVHNGHQHVRGSRCEHPELYMAVRHLRKVKQPTMADVVAIVRLHRVSASAPGT